MRTHPMVLLVLAPLMAACADGNGLSGNDPPTDGILLVSTSTGGGEPDRDGYRLAVDGADSVSLEPTGTVAIGLPPGRHGLRLLGVADRCSVASDTVLEVDVPSRDTVPVAFAINCPATGALIAVTTTGLDLDANGYRVLVDGAERAHVQYDDTVFTRLEPGSRTIALTDLSPNCTAAGPASRTVTVVDTEVVSIKYVVTCTATSGLIRILITASGPVVHESFTATLDGVPLRGEQGEFTVLVPGEPYDVTDVHAGDHVVSVANSPHCSVETGSQSASVTVGALVRDIVEVDFSATCSPLLEGTGTLRISGPTTGQTPPSTRYTVRYATAGYWDYGFGEWTFLDTLEPNGTLVTGVAASGGGGGAIYWYDFDLVGVPANCRVGNPTPPGPEGFTVTARDTLDLVFAVTCPP